MDQIANMFTQLKNAGATGKKETNVSYSKLNMAILEMLKKRGFVENFKEVKDDTKKYPLGITVALTYKNKNELNFNNIKRVSTPGKRVYISANKISSAMRGRAELIISTSQGIMSGKEAKLKSLGGEVIGEVIQ